MQSAAHKRIIPDKGDGSVSSGTMADVFDILTGRRRPISLADYLAMCDTLQKYFVEARRLRHDKTAFCRSEDLLKEIRFVAIFNHKFRESSRDELKVILDDMYEDITI